MTTKNTHPPANEGRSEGSGGGGTLVMLNPNLKNALNQIAFNTLWLQFFSRRSPLFVDCYQIVNSSVARTAHGPSRHIAWPHELGRFWGQSRHCVRRITPPGLRGTA